MTVTTPERYDAPPISPRRLWLSLAAGPLLWSIHLVVSYALLSVSCWWGFWQLEVLGMTALRLILLVFTILTALIVLYGAWVAYGEWRNLRNGEQNRVVAPASRSRFMLYTSVLLNGLFFVVLLVSIWPILFLNLCA